MNEVSLLIPDIVIDNPQPDPDLWNLTTTNWENTFRKWNEIKDSGVDNNLGWLEYSPECPGRIKSSFNLKSSKAGVPNQ